MKTCLKNAFIITASFPIALSSAVSLAFQSKGWLVTTHMPGHISLNLILLKIMEDDLAYHTIILVQSCKLQDKLMVFFPQYIVITHKGKKKKTTKKGDLGLNSKTKKWGKNIGSS